MHPALRRALAVLLLLLAALPAALAPIHPALFVAKAWGAEEADDAELFEDLAEALIARGEPCDEILGAEETEKEHRVTCRVGAGEKAQKIVYAVPKE